MENMKSLIDYIVDQKAKGNSFQEMNYKMKLMLKGIPVNSIDDQTPTDPKVLTKLYQSAQELNVQLPKQFANVV